VARFHLAEDLMTSIQGEQRQNLPVPRRTPAVQVAVIFAAVVLGGAVAWALLAVALTQSRQAALWGAGIAVAGWVAAAVVVARGRRTARAVLTRAAEGRARAHEEAVRLRERIRAWEADAERLADTTLPDAVTRLRQRASVGTVLSTVQEPAAEPLRKVLGTVVEELYQERRTRTAAMAVFEETAGRIQAAVTNTLAELVVMEESHGDQADVLADLTRLDHLISQLGRTAKTLAVLTDARTAGRQWGRPIPVERVLRAAIGSINGWQRVRLHVNSSLAVSGPAAAAVIHAIAELADNAVNFSPQTTEVHIAVREVPAGVVVEIEDSGLAMGGDALERAQRAVSTEPLNLRTLSGNRLGLAAVGCLARRYGLTVHFQPSSYGGTRAVLLVPQQWISQPSAAPVPAATAAAPASAVPAAAGPAPSPPAVRDSGGLPQRRRGATLGAAGEDDPSGGGGQAVRHRPARDSARLLSGFQSAVRGNRGGAAPSATASPRFDEFAEKED
jgi:signal transduction histidine kinase